MGCVSTDDLRKRAIEAGNGAGRHFAVAVSNRLWFLCNVFFVQDGADDAAFASRVRRAARNRKGVAKSSLKARKVIWVEVFFLHVLHVNLVKHLNKINKYAFAIAKHWFNWSIWSWYWSWIGLSGSCWNSDGSREHKVITIVSDVRLQCYLRWLGIESGDANRVYFGMCCVDALRFTVTLHICIWSRGTSPQVTYHTCCVWIKIQQT